MNKDRTNTLRRRARSTAIAVVGALSLAAPVALAQPYRPPPPPPPRAYGPPPPRGYYSHGRYWHHRAWAYGPHHRGYWRYY